MSGLTQFQLEALSTPDGEAMLDILHESFVSDDPLAIASSLRQYAIAASANGTERAVVETLIRAGYDKFIEPLIRSYDPPGPDGIYVEAGRWIMLFIAMKGYDAIRGEQA